MWCLTCFFNLYYILYNIYIIYSSYQLRLISELILSTMTYFSWPMSFVRLSPTVPTATQQTQKWETTDFPLTWGHGNNSGVSLSGITVHQLFIFDSYWVNLFAKQTAWSTKLHWRRAPCQSLYLYHRRLSSHLWRYPLPTTAGLSSIFGVAVWYLAVKQKNIQLRYVSEELHYIVSNHSV